MTVFQYIQTYPAASFGYFVLGLAIGYAAAAIVDAFRSK